MLEQTPEPRTSSAKSYDDPLVVLGNFFDVIVEHKCLPQHLHIFVVMLDVFFATDLYKLINTFVPIFNGSSAFG